MFSNAYVTLPFVDRFAQLLATMLVTLYTSIYVVYKILASFLNAFGRFHHKLHAKAWSRLGSISGNFCRIYDGESNTEQINFSPYFWVLLSVSFQQLPLFICHRCCVIV